MHMSKVSSYLNEHVQGEVTTNAAVRQAMAVDASVLTITPEMVVYPRSTSDIRKVARFTNQLAEKGHVLPITVRGGGTDQTGAAIGRGVIISTTAHLDTIFEVDPKQKLVRVQPGTTFGALNQALGLYGLTVPSAPRSASYSTIGGAIANNTAGAGSGKYGATGAWIHQLEIVLSNGDVLQTGRVSKRELGRKKGMQTFEGEIYRSIDNLITDNQDLIDQLADEPNNGGYAIQQVKRKDGSIDLAPLFAGAQGTLGIVSEIIMQATERPLAESFTALAFESWERARDALDSARSLAPSSLELIDARWCSLAYEAGKRIGFYSDAKEKGECVAFMVVGFDDNDRARKKKLKKLTKLIDQSALAFETTDGIDDPNGIKELRRVMYYGVNPDGENEMLPPSIDGAYIPPDRFEDFMQALDILSQKVKHPLPIFGYGLESVYIVRPHFKLRSVADRQKLLAFTDEYTKLVTSYGGNVVARSGEGRLVAASAYKHLDDDVRALYQGVRDIFDPLGTLNPGVKTGDTLKSLVPLMRKEYTAAPFAGHAPSV